MTTHPNPTPTRTFLLSAALLGGCLLAPAAAFAEAATPPTAAGPPAADVDGLRKEVAELRQMLLQSKQTEQQQRELLLRLEKAVARTGGAAGLSAGAGQPPLAAPAPAVVTGRVTGTVHLAGVPANQAVYAFVEDLRGPAANGHTVDIMQREKQFWPQAIAVPRGTTAFFPNVDHAIHNVFSPGPGTVFDLGRLPSGERGKPVLLSEPGVVQVYCDIHPGMWAEVLVTPNSYFTKVIEGNFRIAHVPVGEHSIAVWTAGAAPVRQSVKVAPQGTTVDLVLNVPARKLGHPNKAGQTYSSTP